MTKADHEILELAAQHRAVEADIDATPGDVDDAAADLLTDIEQRLAGLVPTTPLAAIEQIDILSQHDDAGIRALNVLRELHTPAPTAA